MILRQIQLHPFAGSQDARYALQTGLNVILGPNEAGKSTLVNALRSALFLPVKLHKRDFDKEVQPNLPLGGGDSISVSLEFDLESEAYALSKSWGQAGSISLVLPGGARLSDPAEIAERMAALLGLGQGTVENVLFATQDALGESLEKIGSEGHGRDELADRLRQAVFETDGVSLDKLGTKIAAAHEEAFSRWDLEAGRPEGNKGIDNPWKRGAGEVLKAWYEWQTLQAELEAAEQYERDLAAVNERLQKLTEEREQLKAFLDAHRDAVADAEKRQVLEARLAHASQTEEALRKISHQWPTVEEKARGLKVQMEELAEKGKELKAKLEAARKSEQTRAVRTQLRKAEAATSDLEKARQALKALVPVDRKTLQELERWLREIEQHRARLDRGDLTLTFVPNKALKLKVTEGSASPEEIDTHKDTPLKRAGSARLKLESEDWTLEVTQGGANQEQAAERLKELEKALEDRLAKLKLPDLDKARQAHDTFEAKEREVDLLRRQVDAVLEGKTLEALKEAAGTDGDDSPAGSVSDLAEAHAEAKSEYKRLLDSLQTSEKQIADWKAVHGDSDALLDKVVEARGQKKTLEEQVAKLRPLPGGVSGAAAFIAEFKEKQHRWQDLETGALRDQMVEKASLEARVPERPLSELPELTKDAQAAFDRALREGKAVARIAERFDKLRAEMDQQTLDPWVKDLEEILTPLSTGRYAALDLETGRAATADGLAVPFAVLSAGTRACLGLALRLSMARHFTKDRGGFLILDDPLVDLDPDRQQAAAQMLQAFAETCQVIVLTCHPSHAELLGGERLELQAPAT